VYQLVKIPTDKIRSAWPDVSPLLQKVVDVAPDELTLEGILNRVLKKQEDLMVVTLENTIVAAFTIGIHKVDTGKKQLCIPVISGDDMPQWLADITEQVADLARDYGCYQVKALGARKGWSKVFKEYGATNGNRCTLSINIGE